MENWGLEEITKAAQSMGFVCNDIRASYKHATATECIVLDDMAKTANELRTKLKRFESAIKGE